MRYRLSFLIIISVIGLVSVGSVHGASTSAGSSVSISNSPAYPYYAEITGNSVFIRTGPGTDYYEWGKLYRTDKVKVVGDRDGVWSKIEPLDGSFSWISAQYVTVSGSNPSVGTVTGDNVRVWAGSPLFGPERSTTPQGKLNSGEKVKIIGSPVNNYYKIAVPSLPDAYYWVSTQYTKPIPRETTVVDPISTQNTVDTSTIMDNVTASSESPINNYLTPIPETADVNVADANTTLPVQINTEVTPLDKYYVLQKQVEEERAKPIDEQDYTILKESLLEIVNDENAGKASIFSKAILDRIEGIELALKVEDIIKKQNEEFNKRKESIEKAYQEKLKEVKNLGKYAVIGTFKNFLTFGSGNYRVVDDSDTNVCYAVPESNLAGKDLSKYVGKKVGLVGTIETHTQTDGAKVRFTEIAIIE